MGHRGTRSVLLGAMAVLALLGLLSSASAAVRLTRPRTVIRDSSRQFPFDVSSVVFRTGETDTCLGFDDASDPLVDDPALLLSTVSCSEDRTEFSLISLDLPNSKEVVWQVQLNDDGEAERCLATTEDGVVSVGCNDNDASQLFFVVKKDDGFIFRQPTLIRTLCLQLPDGNANDQQPVEVVPCNKLGPQTILIDSLLSTIAENEEFKLRLEAGADDFITVNAFPDAASLQPEDVSINSQVFRVREVDDDDCDDDDRNAIRKSEDGPWYQLLRGNRCIAVVDAADAGGVDGDPPVLQLAACDPCDVTQQFAFLEQGISAIDGSVLFYIFTREGRQCLVADDFADTLAILPCDFVNVDSQRFAIDILQKTIEA